jgi:hypothetical protein
VIDGGPEDGAVTAAKSAEAQAEWLPMGLASDGGAPPRPISICQHQLSKINLRLSPEAHGR